MARRVARGEVWMYRFGKPDKRRPVVVIGRNDALAWMDTALVVPITSTIREIDSHVPLGVSDGMKGPCAASLDHVQIVRQADLRTYVTTLRPEVMVAVCRALAIATGCA